MRETITTTDAEGNVTTEVLDFIYGSGSTPLALVYTNGTASPVAYYYVTNIQGDVVKMVTASGTAVATYAYDAWGKVLSATGSMAEVNPIRYRGYYYDAEIGMYYLQSRYYDPAVRRFINADAYASTGQGFLGQNMFAYCNNNPACMFDPAGYAAGWTNLAEFCDGGTSHNIVIVDIPENLVVDVFDGKGQEVVEELMTSPEITRIILSDAAYSCAKVTSLGMTYYPVENNFTESTKKPAWEVVAIATAKFTKDMALDYFEVFTPMPIIEAAQEAFPAQVPHERNSYAAFQVEYEWSATGVDGSVSIESRTFWVYWCNHAPDDQFFYIVSIEGDSSNAY